MAPWTGNFLCPYSGAQYQGPELVPEGVVSASSSQLDTPSLLLEIEEVTFSNIGITANARNEDNQIVDGILNMTLVQHNMSPEEAGIGKQLPLTNGNLRETSEEVPVQRVHPQVCRVTPYSGSRITPVRRHEALPVPGPSSNMNYSYQPDTKSLSPSPPRTPGTP